MLTSKSVSGFLDELASNSPAPGGGSVAALAGALGTALTSMVCRLTIGKKKYADVQNEMENVLVQSEKLRSSLTTLIDDDTEAFNKVLRAFALPKDIDEQIAQRLNAIQDSTKEAARIPLKVMQLCEQAIGLTKIVAEKGNVNSITDAGVAALVIHAACKGAQLNVQINLGSIKDQNFVREVSEEMNTSAAVVEKVSIEILDIVKRKILK